MLPVLCAVPAHFVGRRCGDRCKVHADSAPCKWLASALLTAPASRGEPSTTIVELTESQTDEPDFVRLSAVTRSRRVISPPEATQSHAHNQRNDDGCACRRFDGEDSRERSQCGGKTIRSDRREGYDETSDHRNVLSLMAVGARWYQRCARSRRRAGGAGVLLGDERRRGQADLAGPDRRGAGVWATPAGDGKGDVPSALTHPRPLRPHRPQPVLDQHGLDAGRRLPGDVHAGRLHVRRDRPVPREERAPTRRR